MSKRKLFIHVGMAKTGTTTIQYALSQNRKLLLEDGVLVPQACVGVSKYQHGHNELPSVLLRNDYEALGSLIEEIDKSNADTVVVSSETLFGMSRGQIDALGGVFDAYDVKVIAYLREQASFVESLYNQAVKGGEEKRDRHEFLADMLSSNRLNYLSSVKDWAAVFGKENILLKRYESSFVIDGKGLLEDFFGAVGVDLSKLDIRQVSYNKSIDSRFIEFLRVANRIGIGRDVKTSRIVSVLLGSLSGDEERHHRIFGSSERKLVRNYCKASNRALAKEYFDDTDELFVLDDDSGVSVVPDSMTPELLAEIMCRLAASVASR